MRMQNWRNVYSKWLCCLLLLILTSVLSACALFKPVPATPIKHYLLISPAIDNKQTQIPPAANAKIALLSVSEITTPLWLNTTKMAYQLQPDALNYFAYHQWAAPPNQLLQPLVVQTLAQAGIYQHVIGNMAVNNNGQRLQLRLWQMQQQFWQKPGNYQLTVQAILSNAATNQLIATKEFNIQIPVMMATPESGVQAANQAIAVFLKQLVNFCWQHS